MFHKVRHFLHISCAEASEIISRSQDEKVGFVAWLQVLLHNALCKACRAYLRFVRGIGNVLRQRDTAAKMPENLRQTLHKRLDLE